MPMKGLTREIASVGRTHLLRMSPLIRVDREVREEPEQLTYHWPSGHR